MAQLVKRSFPIPEVHDSNPAISKNKKKRPGMGPFEKTIFRLNCLTSLNIGPVSKKVIVSLLLESPRMEMYKSISNKPPSLNKIKR